MPYSQRIRTLEESYSLVDNQLFQLEKSGSADPERLKKLSETREKYLKELRQLRRLQWDYDHEQVHFDDDR